MDRRSRFAPSPTGFLHIGSARTALYSWLYAKNNNGKFILRIEDTDQERSTNEAVLAILESMKWLGLDWDEGPFYQTKRFARYKEIVQQLLEQGLAYRCYCSKSRLDTLREELLAKKLKPRYDRYCLKVPPIDPNAPHVIRFRNPDTGTVQFEDCVRGLVTIANSELDDLILVRADGIPTYNFAVVVDDIDMNITDVIRGEDHIANTPRQINIFHALQAKIPRFTHIPMILGEDGKRLSKRHGAVSVLQYRDQGYLPEALLNYLVRLGWSHGDQEIFTIQEMINLFDLNNINKAAACFNIEKLNWLNQHYIKTIPAAIIATKLDYYMQKLNINISTGPKLEAIVMAQRDRVKTLLEMAEKSRYFYEDFAEIDPIIIQKYLSFEVLEALKIIYQEFQTIQNWQGTELLNIIKNTANKFSLQFGKLAQPIRIAVTGGTTSPSIELTLEMLGRNLTLKRLKQVLQVDKHIKAR